MPKVAQAQAPIFSEEFDAPLNYSTKWFVYNNVNPKGRTYYGFFPTLFNQNGISYARLQMDTWNPEHPGFFKGTLLAAWARHSSIDGYKSFEARMRVSFLKAGAVYAFYPYGPHTSPRGDEIDFEILGNNGLGDKIWLNAWNNAVSSESLGSPPLTTVSGASWSQWHTFKTIWDVNFVKWYVDGVLVKTVSNPIPNEAMAPYLEVWAPNSDFAAAYSSVLQPATSAAGNFSMLLDVDWVRVYSNTSGASPQRVAASSVTLSQVKATLKNEVRLILTGALSAKKAASADNFAAAVNGVQARVSSVQQISSSELLLQLDRSFNAGDTVTVSSNGLTDANDRAVDDLLGTATATAAS